METAVTPPSNVELQLLTDWTEPGSRTRIGRSAVLSLVIHFLAILFLLFMPETFMQPARPKEAETEVTRLVMPHLAITQTAPNPKKIIREVRSSDLSPRTSPPSGPNPEPQAAAPHKPAPAPPPPPKGNPQTPLPEPPKVEIASSEPPKLTLPVPTPQVPQPKNQPDLEDVGAAQSNQRIADQGGRSMQGAGPGTIAPGRSAGGLGTAPVASTGADLPKLLSDPQGVEWGPYLVEVRDAVKRYWDRIAPNLPSVRAGRTGYVSIQFVIKRDGTVGKVVFSAQANDISMNNAAVQAISGGGPFGPLPPRYPGPEIHVQMNFAYNVPRF